MAEQSFKNHARVDPAFHYFAAPVLLLNFGIAVWRFAMHPSLWHCWAFVVALALLVVATLMRTYALRVQDRVILLEERIRMAALLPLEKQALPRDLTTKQRIALRFASDAELAGLTERAVQERLSPKNIKQQIAHWRPDHHRV